jgi:cell division protein FtsB
MRKLPFQSRRAYWASIAGVVALVAGLGYHVVYGEHGYLALRREQRQYRLLQQRADGLQQENQELQKQIDLLKRQDPDAIEKEAREQLHMAKPGEIIFTLPDASSKDQSAVNSSPRPVPAAPDSKSH